MSKNKLSINLNDTIRVKLRPGAIEYLKKEHTRKWRDRGMSPPYAFNPPKVDADGYVKYQLWCFAEAFGGSFCCGFDVLIDTEILME